MYNCTHYSALASSAGVSVCDPILVSTVIICDQDVQQPMFSERESSPGKLGTTILSSVKYILTFLSSAYNLNPNFCIIQISLDSPLLETIASGS